MSAIKSTSYHHGDLRNALIQEGRLYLEEAGLAELSLRGLARRIGVSIGAPVRHFRDKNELLAVLATQGFVELSDVRRSIAASNLAAGDKLREMMRGYVMFALKNPGLFNLMTGPRVLDLSVHNELRETSTASFQLFSDAAQEFARLNGWPPDQRQLVAHAGWSVEHGLATLLITRRAPRDGLDPTQMIELAISIFLEGVTKPLVPPVPAPQTASVT